MNFYSYNYALVKGMYMDGKEINKVTRVTKTVPAPSEQKYSEVNAYWVFC